MFTLEKSRLPIQARNFLFPIRLEIHHGVLPQRPPLALICGPDRMQEARSGEGLETASVPRDVCALCAGVVIRRTEIPRRKACQRPANSGICTAPVDAGCWTAAEFFTLHGETSRGGGDGAQNSSIRHREDRPQKSSTRRRGEPAAEIFHSPRVGLGAEFFHSPQGDRPQKSSTRLRGNRRPQKSSRHSMRPRAAARPAKFFRPRVLGGDPMTGGAIGG